MSEKSGGRAARTKRSRVTKTSKTSRIPDPFQVVDTSLVAAGNKTIKVPVLILRGEWLKQCGFPVGAPCYLTTDRIGEIALHRLGLGLPRRLRIVAG